MRIVKSGPFSLARLPCVAGGGTLPAMRPLILGLGLTLAMPFAGCKTSETKQETTTADKASQPGSGEKDRSRCDSSGKKVTTVDLNGDGKPDVWKFYATVVENGANLEVLTCKEVDLNMDGKKDAWLYYENNGNIANEEYDLDFDGKIDLWVYRQNNKIVREEYDSNFDGKPDIWKFYENDKLARLERSTKKNGKVDVWEYYEGGKLDRIGYDTTGSGQIDRWDRAPEEASATPASSSGGAAAAAGGGAGTIPQPPTATPETGSAKEPAAKPAATPVPSAPAKQK